MTERAMFVLLHVTVEGLVHKELLIPSVQYHSERCRGPQDNVQLFDRFFEMVKNR